MLSRNLRFSMSFTFSGQVRELSRDGSDSDHFDLIRKASGENQPLRCRCV